MQFHDSVAQLVAHLLYLENAFGQINPALGVVLETRRYPGRIALRGCTPASAIRVFTYDSVGMANELSVLSPDRRDYSWWSWEVAFDPRITVVELALGATDPPVRRLELSEGSVVAMTPIIAGYYPGAA
ncbi:hypothetical protein [Microbacterium ulmi]|uniref:Uncharacterized protein n=1 Tax=Microbacterium ulmi TaxID=179095 RepID=A0A7Y2Q0S7_9MICO|nr:hypothetical protein [Microbacterium ulmi]NII69824.1 hypothetical protein [Microbacterium ulmi]NNH03205.1 hypothetical protein [Microbacterium ulmi]